MTMKQVIKETCNSEAEEKLFRAVVRQVGDWKGMYQYPMDYRNASGGVSGFISYYDTNKFARRYMVEIMEVLWAFEDEIGEPLQKDSDQPLNWLAWFALETIVQKIMDFKEV